MTTFHPFSGYLMAVLAGFIAGMVVGGGLGAWWVFRSVRSELGGAT